MSATCLNDVGIFVQVDGQLGLGLGLGLLLTLTLTFVQAYGQFDRAEQASPSPNPHPNPNWPYACTKVPTSLRHVALIGCSGP